MALAASFGAMDTMAVGEGFDVSFTDGAASDGGAALGVAAIDESGDTDGDGEAAMLAHPTKRTTDSAETATLDT
jgi:hypothetical protein